MAAKKKSEKDIQKQIAELPVLKPKAGMSASQLAQRACHANFILHQAHKIYWEHKYSAEAKNAWLKSVDDFNNAVCDVYPKGFWDHFYKFLKGETKHLDLYLSFLEMNLWFFRSGYVKADIMRVLKRTALEEKQVERLRRIILDAVQQHDRREFRSYCRLAQRVDCQSFREDLEKLTENEDKNIRRRANWVLEYLPGATLVKSGKI